MCEIDDIHHILALVLKEKVRTKILRVSFLSTSKDLP